MLSEEYVPSHKGKMLFSCRCGNHFEKVWNVFLRQTCCSECGNRRGQVVRGLAIRRTHSQFLEQLHKIHGNKFTIQSQYEIGTKKIQVVCNQCNHQWQPTPNNLLQGSGCPECYRHTRRKSQAEFLAGLIAVHGDRLTTCSEYTGDAVQLEMECNYCKNKWNATPSNLLRGTGCPKCARAALRESLRKSHTQFVSEVLQVHDGVLTVTGKYVNWDTPVEIQCGKCGLHWYPIPNSILRGHGCPHCKSSAGELAIAELMDSLQLNYEPQYKFPDCRNQRELPFDFAVLDSSQNPTLLIEFDGKQHFEPVDFFGGQESFEYRKQNDSIKNTYCAYNNIPLLRIPYWEQGNIEQLITDKLYELKILQKAA